ncbi:MAG: Ig-like domain-containing protein, partial [Victivallales bacterium]|nr:Ig-like domain-containing protein [Victivallales bacterium]
MACASASAVWRSARQPGSKSSSPTTSRTLDYAYTTEVAGGGFTLDGKEIYGDSTIRLYTKKNTDSGLLKSFTLNKTEVSLRTAEYADLSLAAWSPSDATNLDVRWSSSDNAVAYMADDKDGRVVGGGKSGTAIVTAMSSNGIFATCTVTVTAK